MAGDANSYSGCGSVVRHPQRRDQVEKRTFYLRTGVDEYWIVNRWDRTIQVITSNADDVTADRHLLWHPTGASTALVIDVAEFFRSVLG